MTGLREMFEDLAESPPPPSQVTGDEMYTAGRQRRRRRTRIIKAVTTLAVTAVAAAAASVVNVMSPPPEPAGGSDPLPAGNINWTGAADARHLYAAVQACPDQSCSKVLTQLYFSDNGGQGWTPRGDAIMLVDATVVGPSTLVATIAGKAAPSVSTNGGHTWTLAQRRSPAAAVPPGAALFCWTESDSSWCRPYVVDPAGGWFAALTKPPALAQQAQWVRAGDRLWAAGTNTNGQPAVAVSTDAGRTWSTRTLACPRQECSAVVTTTADGNTAYAVVTAPYIRIVYRGGVTGGWTRMSTQKTADKGGVGGERSFVTADGTHVLYDSVPVGVLDGRSFWANSGPDTPYQRVAMEGLPATVYPILRTPDGWFFTHSYGRERALYGSADGRHWSVIPSTLTKE
ncbi:hypothetical protein [Micromonospora sp. CPCC 206061]|uniref:hypothetical protein n=1 Tax=Micromonospora sp. CPCC 206061 TaxID=3122410 RepID=UPI002FF32908